MSHIRMVLATAVDAPWKFPHLHNDTKVKMGVCATVGSCIMTMLLMIPA